MKNKFASFFLNLFGYLLLIPKAYAQDDEIIGTINPPSWLEKHGSLEVGGEGGFGLINFLSNVLRLISVVAGLWALVNLLLAGIGFISSAGDSEKVSQASSKIWQTLMGLVVIAMAYTLAAIIGWIFFGNAGMIINPKVYGPGT
ncbi:MAG TPA: hypothetical protein VMW29_02000 [Candidatus Bathyarchaeia archaeon]|nr:hypothetical protein [Candidatus Bathyarchaeia archaeon]